MWADWIETALLRGVESVTLCVVCFHFRAILNISIRHPTILDTLRISSHNIPTDPFVYTSRFLPNRALKRDFTPPVRRLRDLVAPDEFTIASVHPRA